MIYVINNGYKLEGYFLTLKEVKEYCAIKNASRLTRLHKYIVKIKELK